MGGMIGAITGSQAKRAGKVQAWAQNAGADAFLSYAKQGEGELRNSLTNALGYLQPSIDAGNTSRNSLMSLLGLNGQDAANNALAQFRASPDYSYRRDEALKGVEQSAAARGRLYSGGTLKALQSRGDSLADAEMDNYQNDLMKLLGFGEIASGNSAAMTQSTGNALANLFLQMGNAKRQGIVGAGDAQANGMIAQSNALNNLFSQGLSLAGQIAGSFGGMGGMGNALGGMLGGGGGGAGLASAMSTGAGLY